MSFSIRHLLISAGTHGNEWTGIHVLRHLQSNTSFIERMGFKTSLLLSNSMAIEANRRYIHRDLNRSFKTELMNDPLIGDFEVKRAKEIMNEFGPSSAIPADLVIDLHTTTAATGPSVILSHDSLINLHLARWLSESIPRLKVALWSGNRNTGFMKDAIPNGITFEIGPIPQSTLHAETYLSTMASVLSTVDFVQAWNSTPEIFTGLSLDIYEPYKTVDYPRDSDGALTAMLHPEIDGADFKLFEGIFNAFLDLSGEPVPMTVDRPSYPMFVGEASYYEKNVAFYLTSKRSLLLPPHPES